MLAVGAHKLQPSMLVIPSFFMEDRECDTQSSASGLSDQLLSWKSRNLGGKSECPIGQKPMSVGKAWSTVLRTCLELLCLPFLSRCVLRSNHGGGDSSSLPACSTDPHSSVSVSSPLARFSVLGVSCTLEMVGRWCVLLRVVVPLLMDRQPF